MKRFADVQARIRNQIAIDAAVALWVIRGMAFRAKHRRARSEGQLRRQARIREMKSRIRERTRVATAVPF